MYIASIGACLMKSTIILPHCLILSRLHMVSDTHRIAAIGYLPRLYPLIFTLLPIYFQMLSAQSTPHSRVRNAGSLSELSEEQ
jgi:hypothetical protein